MAGVAEACSACNGTHPQVARGLVYLREAAIDRCQIEAICVTICDVYMDKFSVAKNHI